MRPAGRAGTLAHVRVREALDQSTTAALRRMAALHGLPVDDATTRTELVERLSERLGDPTYQRGRLEALDERERRALAAARAAGGEVRGYLLVRLLGSAGLDAARPLLEHGFLFRTFAALGPHRGEVFAVPEEILALLPGEAPAGADAPGGLPRGVEPPPREHRRASDPVFSLFVLASFLQRHASDAPEEPGAQASAFQAEGAGWAQEPGGWPWQERWAFLRHLALGAGLLGRRSDGTATPTALLLEALSERPRLVLRLWRAYLDDREWSELVRGGVPQAAELAEQVDPPSMRQAVLRVLGRLAPGTWTRLDDLLAWLERAVPTFLREQLDARSAALLDPATGQPLLGEGSWGRVEAVLLRYLLLGPLYWLGVLATDADGERVATTNVGAALLGRAPPIPTRAAEPCTWDGSNRLLAPARADLGALLRAERYLELRTRGQPSSYTLDRGRVGATLESGGSIQECTQLLERLTGGPLPGSVAAQLAAWESRFGALALRPAVILDARSAEELQAAAALEGVKPFIRRPLGPTVAEVPASHALELAQALRAAGHLPRVDAALRLMAGRRAYAAFVDERVLEFLLVSLLAFQRAEPQHLAQLEGSLTLLERLEGLFPPERLEALRAAASSLAGELRATGRRARSRPLALGRGGGVRRAR